jgi:hypothetical protein
MTLKLFYTDYTNDKHIKSDEAITATTKEIGACMSNLLREPDNFLGIIDDNDVMLQFMVENDGSICVDLPVNERKGSFTKHTDLKGCIKLAESLSETIELDKIDSLVFTLWCR